MSKSTVSKAVRETVRNDLVWLQDFLMTKFKLKAHEAKQTIREELEST